MTDGYLGSQGCVSCIVPAASKDGQFGSTYLRCGNETGDGPWRRGVAAKFSQEFVLYALPTAKSNHSLSTVTETEQLVR